MSTFFNDTMQGLLEAVAIKNGDIPVAEVEGMPAKTYRASNIKVDNNESNPDQESDSMAAIV